MNKLSTYCLNMGTEKYEIKRWFAAQETKNFIRTVIHNPSSVGCFNFEGKVALKNKFNLSQMCFVVSIYIYMFTSF